MLHTNGTVMTEELAERIIKSGLDRIIFSLDSDVRCLTAKSGMTLLNCLAIYDYDLFDFSGRKITPTTVKKGSGKVVGNAWHHCLHLEEGQEIFYATYS